jgi:sugar phosphate isomerase/epimerase
MDEDLARQLAYWRELDARRFSLVGPQLDAAGVRLVQDALAVGSYTLETIVHPFTAVEPLDAGARALHQARAGLSAQLGVARRLHAHSIYMTTGGRGSLAWEQAAKVFADAIAPCVAEAREAGIPLMIENAPPQYADLHIAHTLRDTVTLAEIAGIGVCIDLFGCWTEADLRASLARAVPHCHLVQVSDYVLGDRSLPARAVPGDGAMPLSRMLEWILDAGYEGAFDLELIGPRIDREGHLAATRRAVDELAALLGALGA